MRLSLGTGFSFGLTSGIITTLGLMVGLHSGTHLETAVIGGILTIAIADAFSDALGVHVSQEYQDRHTQRSIWEATISTFLTKLVVALTFIVPVLLFDLLLAVVISIIWGLSLLSLFSYIIARREKNDPKKVVLEHLVIALIVIVIAHFVGDGIAQAFG